MLKVAFWNIAKQPIEDLVADLAAEFEIDVVLLAECQAPRAVLLALNRNVTDFHYCSGENRRVHMFARLARDQVRNLGGLDYGDAWSLVSADSEPVSLFLVHIPCTWADASSQQYYAIRQSDKIYAVELAEGHDRSIVVGDFNMNPFDASMVNGFNATMSEPMARKGSRRIGAVERKFFFNPMWSLIGQRTDGPPGTFYFNKSLPLTYYWHALDQVLVRPSLLDALDQKSVQIVSRIRRRDLLTRGGLPDKRHASDHLPIVFRLHLNGETNGAETVRANSMA